MGKQYLKKLVKYMKKVYDIEQGLGKLKDERMNPTYSTIQVILPVLFGFILRIQSFNQLNGMLKSKDFKNLVPKKTKLPLIDTIRSGLKTIALKGPAKINSGVIRKQRYLILYST